MEAFQRYLDECWPAANEDSEYGKSVFWRALHLWGKDQAPDAFQMCLCISAPWDA